MGFKIVSLIFLVAGISFLPFWPYSPPWPKEANTVICGFCFFVAILTFLVSIVARRGSNIWKDSGQG